MPKYEQEGREKIRELNNEVTIFAVGHLIDDLRKKYLDLPEVVSFLNEIQEDIIENVDEFLSPPEHPLAALMGISLPTATRGPGFFRRYQVNVLVDHSASHGAPVVYEDHPTYQNLLGQVEYIAHLGAALDGFQSDPAGRSASREWRLSHSRRIQTAPPAICLGGTETFPAILADSHRVARADAEFGEHSVPRT